MPTIARPSLPELQRWMRWVLTYPAGADEAIKFPAGKAPLPKNWTRGTEPKRWLPVIGESSEVSQGTRLAIYGDGYFIRIVDVMAGNYSVLCAVLGDHEFRHHLAREYLIKHPSVHKCIDNIGNFMPEFLKKHAFGKQMPFLSDLARLEWAYHESFYADEWPLIDGAAFKDVLLEKWPAARISLDPSVRLLEVNYPVLPLWRDDGKWSARRLKAIKKKPTPILVYRRPDAQVRVAAETPAAFALLKAFQAGQEFRRRPSRRPEKGPDARQGPAALWRVDRPRYHPPGGVPLNASAGDDSPPPSKSRLLWILFLALAILAGRMIPFRSLGAQDDYTVHIGATDIFVTVHGQLESISGAELKDFIENSARGVAAYFGRFPIPRANIIVNVNEGRGVDDGRATPGIVPTIRIGIGSQATRRGLEDDWILVHEMTHLGFPDVEGPHHWMTEGFATYVEPIERVRNGSLSVDRFWSDMVKDIPQGVPQPYDTGLNTSDSWAATYWGGALFWFLADVQIRQLTGNKKGLEDVMRALNREGGDMRERWSLKEFLKDGRRDRSAPNAPDV